MAMDFAAIRVLHVEDNPGDARLMREHLLEAGGSTFDLTVVPRVDQALASLESRAFDAVLLDLSLPDAHGLDTVRQLCAAAPDVPVVVLTGLDDETLAIRAVQVGAQDYLIKSGLDPHRCVRAIRYGIERHRSRRELWNLSLMDEMTGLYNRRGFLALAEQHFRVANREHCDLVLIFCDLDHLKEINDRYGHREGDRALTVAARILRDSLRATDLVARIGGDEFTILALDTTGTVTANITERLRERFEAHNRTNELPYSLSLCMGVARRDPRSAVSMSDLLAEADRALYEEKWTKQQNGGRKPRKPKLHPARTP